MATSSIIEKIQVNNPKAIEAFVEAMDSSGENYHIIHYQQLKNPI